MVQFQIRYHNTQGTLMRILGSVSRRGIDLPFVEAGPVGALHRATLLLAVTPAQVAQLGRDWRAIVDVEEVSEPLEMPDDTAVGEMSPPQRQVLPPQSQSGSMRAASM
jgi:acetolactate synthase small subunit